MTYVTDEERSLILAARAACPPCTARVVLMGGAECAMADVRMVADDMAEKLETLDDGPLRDACVHILHSLANSQSGETEAEHAQRAGRYVASRLEKSRQLPKARR